MQGRPALGEAGLASIFGLTGIIWIAGAMGLPLWQGFAPDSGFLPLIYGVLLTGLSAVVFATVFWGGGAVTAGPVGKPLLVLAALTAGVIGLSTGGFSISIFLMLLFLYAAVEKRPLFPSLVVAAGTTAALFVIFKTWLGVPLPLGPFGI
jgi:putative tricarboxylic transport membrane protein